jgi:hypothetical protein
MNVKDLKCYPQVVAVIGEALADYELGRVIDSDVSVTSEGMLTASFIFDESPQKKEFWLFIDEGQNPYDHGHEKPEVKEWAYINGKWMFEDDGYFIDQGGVVDSFYSKAGRDNIVKSVTMPDWVPAEIATTNSVKDKTMTKEEVKAFVGDLTVLGPNNNIPNYKIGEKESNLFFGAKPENDNEKNERLKLASNRACEAKQPTAASILESGLGHMKDRAVTYDNPQGERSMGKTVDMFNILYGLELTEEQGWAFMAILKLVRTSQGEFKLDNYEGMAAYAGLMGEAAFKLAAKGEVK